MRFADAGQQPFQQCYLVRLGNVRLDQADGIPLAQDAGGRAGEVPFDAASGRIGRLSGNARQLQRSGVNPPGMHVHSLQHHWRARCDVIQQPAMGWRIPTPTPALHPTSWRSLFHGTAHPLAHFLWAVDTKQAYLLTLRHVVEEMHVGVGQSRQHQPFPHIDDTGGGPGQACHIVIAAHRQDAPLRAGHRFRPGGGPVNGEHACIVKNQVRLHPPRPPHQVAPGVFVRSPAGNTVPSIPHAVRWRSCASGRRQGFRSIRGRAIFTLSRFLLCEACPTSYAAGRDRRACHPAVWRVGRGLDGFRTGCIGHLRASQARQNCFESRNWVMI